MGNVMENTVYIFTPEPSDEYGAFNQRQNIEQPRPICSLCEENEATHLVKFKKHDRENKAEVCLSCYYDPDFRDILQNSILISVTKIN
jgi:hypothetical protein